jgi:hypothetical protein
LRVAAAEGGKKYMRRRCQKLTGAGTGNLKDEKEKLVATPMFLRNGHSSTPSVILSLQAASKLIPRTPKAILYASRMVLLFFFLRPLQILRNNLILANPIKILLNVSNFLKPRREFLTVPTTATTKTCSTSATML